MPLPGHLRRRFVDDVKLRPRAALVCVAHPHSTDVDLDAVVVAGMGRDIAWSILHQAPDLVCLQAERPTAADKEQGRDGDIPPEVIVEAAVGVLQVFAEWATLERAGRQRDP